MFVTTGRALKRNAAAPRHFYVRYIILLAKNMSNRACTSSPLRIHADEAADSDKKHGHLDPRPRKTETGHAITDKTHVEDDTDDHSPLSWFPESSSSCNAVNPPSSGGITPDRGGASAENTRYIVGQ